jgi:hypothetical protein
LNVTQHGSAITPIEAGPKQLENANSCATNDPDTGLPDLVEVGSDSDGEVEAEQVVPNFKKGPS